jgi:two-component system nitrogen regulation response regulator GlnG
MKNKILIAGDEPDIFFAFKKILRSDRCHIFTLTRSDNMLHFISRQYPALLILNLKLYGNFTTDILVRIRQLYPGLPILVMTAFTNVLTEELILRLGATGYIRMPFDIHETLIKIRQFIQA